MDYEELNYGTLSREQQLESSLAFPVLMRKVYLWMSLALVITGFTAFYVATSESLLTLIYGNKIVFWVVALAPLALVFVLSAGIQKLSLTAATLVFVLYSVLMGASLSSIFLTYSTGSIAQTFFVSAATFGTMAFYGYVTKKDLTSWGRLFFMALLGLIIALVVNIFLDSSLLEIGISCFGVIIFVGLTAYDSQNIKNMLLQAPDASESMQKIALMGALTLYLDFINLFLYLLRLFGNSRD
ncbi:MAG: Bax inhibitor-1/YccA family protein [Prevotella sp.]|nr:Bax inhibitor-1/YccA family protein [Prevotella sp.]